MRTTPRGGLLDPLPLDLPADWSLLVKTKQAYEEVDRIEHPAPRGRPVAALSRI